MKGEELGGGWGTRALFRDDLKEWRIDHPRGTLNRQIGLYLSRSIAKRPLFGLHQLVRLTEYLVNATRNGKAGNRRFTAEAEDLYFRVRTRMHTVFTNHGGDWTFTPEEKGNLRIFVENTVDDCNALYRRLRASRKASCPVCGGSGRVYEDIAVKAVQFAHKLLDEGVVRREDIPFAVF